MAQPSAAVNKNVFLEYTLIRTISVHNDHSIVHNRTWPHREVGSRRSRGPYALMVVVSRRAMRNSTQRQRRTSTRRARKLQRRADKTRAGKFRSIRCKLL